MNDRKKVNKSQTKYLRSYDIMYTLNNFFGTASENVKKMIGINRKMLMKYYPIKNEIQ